MLEFGTVIIVGRGAPEIWCQRTAFPDELRPVHGIAFHVSGHLVETYPEVLSRDNQMGQITVVDLRDDIRNVTHAFVLQNHVRCLIGPEFDLCLGHHVTRRNDAFSFPLQVSHVEQPFAFPVSSAPVQGHRGGLLRLAIYPFHRSAAHDFSVFQCFPLHDVCRKVAEEILVVYLDFAFRQISGRGPDVLVEVSHFVAVRVRYTVGTEQAVDHVIVVLGLIIVEVPVVTVYHFPVATGPSRRLVHPVPDEAALELGILPD